MANRFFVGNGTNWTSTSSWSTTSGGSSGASVPTASDDVILDANSPGVCNINTSAPVARSLDATNYTHALTWVTTGTLSLGTSTANGTLSFKLGAGATTAGTAGSLKFIGTSGTQELITSAGVTIAPSITFNGAGGSWQLSGNGITTTQSVTLIAGTLDLNGTTNSWGSFTGSGSSTRSLLTTNATISLTGTGVVWVLAATGATFTGFSSCVWNITDTSSSTKTFNPTGAGSTIGTINVTGGGTGAVSLSGSSITYGTISIGAPKTFQFSTSTNTISNLVANGSSGNVITLKSITGGTTATINQPATVGGISLNWCSIQDIHNSGPATIWAGANSTNVSNNTGITFTAPAWTQAFTQATSVTSAKTLAGKRAITQAQSVNPGRAVATKASVSQSTSAQALKTWLRTVSATQATSTTSTARKAFAAAASATQSTTTTAASIGGRSQALTISQASAAVLHTGKSKRLDISTTPPLRPTLGQHCAVGKHPSAGGREDTTVVMSGVPQRRIAVPQAQPITQRRQLTGTLSVAQTQAISRIVLPGSPVNTAQSTSSTARPNVRIVRTASQSQATTLARMLAALRTPTVSQQTHLNIASVAVHGSTVGIRQPQDTTVGFVSNTLNIKLAFSQPAVWRVKRQVARKVSLTQTETVGANPSHVANISVTQPTAVIGVGFPFGPIVIFLPMRSQPTSLGLKSRPTELEVI